MSGFQDEGHDWRAEAEALTDAAEGDEFVRAAAGSPAGREFLGTEDWARVQGRLFVAAVRDRSRGFGAVDAGGPGWERLVDEMVTLSTVKMVQEFRARLQSHDLGRLFLGGPVWRRWARARFPEFNPLTGQAGPVPRRPRVGDDVLYVVPGAGGGGEMLPPVERPAKVTEAGSWLVVEMTGQWSPHRPKVGSLRRVLQVWDPMAVCLFVMGAGGAYQDGPALVDLGEEVSEGHPDFENTIDGRLYRGGTWHWPADPVTAVMSPAEIALDPEAQKRAERLAAGICPEHGDKCASWVPTVGGGGTHVGEPRWSEP